MRLPPPASQKEHVERILANIAGIPGPRDKPLPFKQIVATRQCPRRNDVIIADLIMFDDKRAELEVFENGRVDGKVVWGGFWSYVPEGFPLFRNGEWRRGDPEAYGVTYGIVFHEMNGSRGRQLVRGRQNVGGRDRQHAGVLLPRARWSPARARAAACARVVAAA